MFTKAVALFALIAAAQAGVQYIDQHVGAQSEQTIRGLGYAGLGTISSQSKAVDSAFSSVRKHDTRVINPAVSVAAAPVAYASPVHQQVAYGPAIAAAPVAYASPVHQQVAYGPAIAAAPVARVAAPVAYAAPVAKAVAAPASLLGVAYSSVPQVAHLNFDGFGVHYGY